jgi:solute carrier family 25 (mitochondrial citrate transporter), member 1
VDCALKTVREDGALGLWAGAAPTVLRNGTNQMCLFWAKNHMDGILWGGCNICPVSMSRVLQPTNFCCSTAGTFSTRRWPVLRIIGVLTQQCAH